MFDFVQIILYIYDCYPDVKQSPAYMKKFTVLAAITTVLACLSVIALVAMYLALSDIAHGDEDLTLEWRIVQVCYGVCWLLTVSVLVTLGLKVRTKGKDQA
jgi:fumarate reductase subunit D